MAQLVCPTCGTSYDTSGFTPGQRFRCRGDGCTNKLTVPGGAGGGGASGGGGDTPTPAGGQPARRPTGAAKKPSGVAKAAAPAAAVPADEDDVLEPNVPTAKTRRGDTGRRAKPGAGPGRPMPKAASPAPLYAGIGGVLLILVIVVIAVFSKGDSNAAKPRREKTPGWKKEAVTAPTTASADPVVPAAGEGETAAPEPEKPKVRTKKTFRFVEKDGLAAKVEALYDKLMDEDPNVASDASAELGRLGADAVPVILNKIDTIKYNSMKGRSLGYHLMEILHQQAPEALDDEKLSETLVVNPNDSGMHSFQDAARDWRAFWRDRKGLAVNDAEVPD